MNANANAKCDSCALVSRVTRGQMSLLCFKKAIPGKTAISDIFCRLWKSNFKGSQHKTAVLAAVSYGSALPKSAPLLSIIAFPFSKALRFGRYTIRCTFQIIQQSQKCTPGNSNFFGRHSNAIPFCQAEPRVCQKASSGEAEDNAIHVSNMLGCAAAKLTGRHDTVAS